MEININQIHDVVIDALKEKDISYSDITERDIHMLKLISEWYYNFIISKKTDFSFTLPFYEESFTKLAYQYFRFFLFTIKLLNEKETTKYEETCIFDIFNYSQRQNISIDKYLLKYTGTRNNFAVWNNEVYTPSNVFIPIFNQKQLESLTNLSSSTIFRSFALFKAIRKHNLISNPVTIDLENGKNLFFDCFGNEYMNDLILAETMISCQEIMSQEDAINLEDELDKQSIAHRIKIRYPYSKKPHYYLLEAGDKRFSLNFANRFAYKEIGEHDVFLLPKEINNPKEENLIQLGRFDVFTTNHSAKLFTLMSSIKQQWKDLGLNKYQYPFPKDWFLFISQGMAEEGWIRLFEETYPTVANSPIIHDIKDIISELYDLDWISLYLKENSEITLMFPEMSGLKENRLRKAFSKFKNYVYSNYPKVKIESEINDDDTNIQLLNGFDIVGLVNTFQNTSHNNYNYSVLIPDFLYFAYNPWVKCHLYEYQSAALYSDFRKSIYPNLNNENAQKESQKLIKEIKKERASYFNKYKEKEAVIIQDLEDEILVNDIEDFEYKNDEETSIFDSPISKAQEEESCKLKIITTDDSKFEAKKVYCLRNTLISLPAKDLEVGDLFLLSSDLKSISIADFIDKLSEVPESVKKYQIELSKDINLYSQLKPRGLSYSNERYFKENYQINEGDYCDELFRIPRRKSDWKVICDYLSITNIDENRAFIAYYGRTQQNSLKEIILKIINFIIDNDSFGELDSPTVINEISKIITNIKLNTTQAEEENKSIEFTCSLIEAIKDQLIFHTVKKIIYE